MRIYIQECYAETNRIIRTLNKSKETMICFTLDNIHVSMLLSRNIPPSSSPTESKILFCTSVSLFLFCIQGYCYHLSKFHIYALVYCIGLYLSGLLCMMGSSQITSPGWMNETSAWALCTGKTQRYWVERQLGDGNRMGNTCKSMADSCQCMTKTTAIL